mgnify:CR=1 FL=1
MFTTHSLYFEWYKEKKILVSEWICDWGTNKFIEDLRSQKQEVKLVSKILGTWDISGLNETRISKYALNMAKNDQDFN